MIKKLYYFDPSKICGKICHWL